MTIEDPDERSFYEIEAVKGAWNVKTLKRQYHSSLYERLALSRDKNDVMNMAEQGAMPYNPEDILKTPYFLEFVGLEDKSSYHEDDLEAAVLNKLQDFLLEMGKGFLFEKRQRRFTFNDKNFYCDLVLYNRFLRSLDKITIEIMNISYSKGGDYSEDIIRSFAMVYIDEFL